MKKYSSYILPALVVLVILSLIFRWYRNRQRVEKVSEFGEGIQIENLTDQEVSNALKGVGDYQTVDLKPEPTASPVTSEGEMAAMPNNGMIRYDIADGKVKFSVMATLPEMSVGRYQVWLRTLDDSTLQRVFVLEMNKGGYVGSAAVSQDLLPFEVIVSKEMTDDSKMEDIIMRGTITKPSLEMEAE